MAMARGETFKTVSEMTLSYAQTLYKARAYKNGKPKFGCTLIGSKSDKALCAQLEKQVIDVATAEWGDKALEQLKAGVIRNPILKGDSKEARNAETGEINPGLGPDKFFIRVQSGEERPPFVIWKDPNIQETETNVYSGCTGKGTLNAFAWKDDQGGRGVSFGIAGFQKLHEGERIGGGGRADPKDYYEKVEGEDLPADVKNDGAAGLFG